MRTRETSSYLRNIRHSFLSVCMGTLLFLYNASSQTFNRARMDSYFDSLEKHNKFMGSIAVAKNGNIIYTRTVGFTDVATKTKPTIDTRYRIGSISKTLRRCWL